MFVLSEWTVINMFDWVRQPLAVSESKERLIERHSKNFAKDRVPTVPLIDTTQDEDLEKYCERRNAEENRTENRRLTTSCFDCYWSIDTIDCL